MTTFIGLLHELPEIKINEREVKSYHWIPLDLLMDDLHFQSVHIPSGNSSSIYTKAFNIGHGIPLIWGATAIVLRAFTLALRKIII